MVEETVSRPSVRSAGRALLASLALAGLTAAFAWAAPERNGWAALALAVALALDGLAQGAGAWLARRGGGPPRIAGLPSLVLAFGPAAGLGTVPFAVALAAWPAGFPILASALAGLIAMGAIARLVLAWIVLRIAQDPEA
ncbi:hypothetical protein [Methylobacterium sp. Leaf88]|uniref:hypothetical protein n=1 Tax=Methylobacterium sp. Leaf88 TaxID=1736244 RepID=UPI0006F8A7AF|nr:hypothetical protein [Methylobacterium sp. Leaf88]KQO62571.1 hypothetical protein ASF20_08485 [Methylobacterium sp. Leaf88]